MADDFIEGQTATNPQTGAKVVWRNGAWHNATAADTGNTDTIVNALIDGRMSFPTDSRALNKPYWQNLLAKVSEKDPTFDTIDYKARAKTRQDFTSGKSAQNITSFNTLLHHIGTLQQAADELGNYGGLATPLNSVANSILENTGSDRPTNFRQAKNAVVGEAVRAFRGVGGARGDIEEAASAIPENGSPEQIRGSLKTLAALLHGRIKSLGEQYSAGMGKTSDGINLLDDDARKTLESLGITSEQAKGGDQQSGTAGAGANGSAPPPTGPGTPPPINPGGQDVQFNDQAPQLKQGLGRLTPEQNREYYSFLLTKPTAEQIQQHYAQYGAGQLSSENAQQLADYYAKGGKGFGVDYSGLEVKPVDAGDGQTGAAARGAYNILTGSFGDEIGAVADTVTQGGTYAENVNRRRGYDLYDEQNRGGARLAGQLIGSLPLGGIEFLGAREAARAAGIAAVRSGTPVAEARTIANRVFAQRTAAEAAGFGAVNGAGDANGSVGDRLAGAGIGAAVGGALGGGTALAGGRFARALAARRAARLGQPASEQQAALAAADRQGIVPFAPDVGGSVTRRATGAVAQTVGGVVPVRRAAQATLDSAEAVRDRVAASIGQAQNPELAGETARAGAQAFIARTGARIGRIYEAADQAAGQARIETPEAIRVLDRGLAPLAESPVQGPGVAILQGLRQSLNQPQTVRGLRQMRTLIRDEFESAGLRGSNIERIAGEVVDAATDDIVNGLRAQGFDRAATQYRVADRMWRERLQTIDDHLEPILGGNTPKSGEQIVQALQASMKGNNRRFEGFINALPANEQGTVRASLIQRLGRATKGNQDQDGEVFSLSTFLTNWDDIGERAKNTLFGADGRAALNDLARYAAQSKESQRFANFSNTGAAVTTSALGASVAAGPVGVAAAAKVLMAQYAAGRLLASPRFARWLARPPRTNTPAATQAYVERLSRIARAEPAVANDILAIQSRLQDAFGRSPARLAAQEGNNGGAPINGQGSNQQSASDGFQP